MEKSERRCPKRSVVGPLLWNVMLESLLRIDLGECVTITVFVNDRLLMVRGKV